MLHLVLPPVFRALALCFDLPHRRFYTPATHYTHVPVENGLHPIPSVIDLPSTGDIHSEDAKSGVKRRGRRVKSDTRDNETIYLPDSFLNQEKELEIGRTTAQSGTEVKHYDTDGTLLNLSFLRSEWVLTNLAVLTKVVVYSGITFLSVEVIPLLFSLMGWGIKPW